MMMFPLDLEQDDNGTFLVTCPLLPEVTTFGESWADAVHQAAEAIEEAVAARVARWENVPIPDSNDLAPRSRRTKPLGFHCSPR